MMGIGKRLWREMKEPIFALIGFTFWLGDAAIILGIIYRHWSWGWWFLVPFPFLIGLFLIFLPIEVIPIIFKVMKGKGKSIT